MIYIPFSILSFGIVWSYGFTQKMFIKHILIFIFHFLTLVPIIITTRSTVASTQSIMLVLRDIFARSFSEEIHRYNAIKRIKEFRNSVIGAFPMVAIACVMGMFWPFYRTRIIYTGPSLAPFFAFTLVQHTLAFSNSGHTFDVNEKIDFFLFIVNNPHYLEIFMKFLQSEHSSENLLFWLRIEEYRLLPYEENTDKTENSKFIVQKQFIVILLLLLQSQW